MPQVTTSLSINLIDEIKKLSRKINKSFSMTINELIQHGMESYADQQKQRIDKSSIYQDKKMTEYEKNHYAHLVTTLNLVMEINKKLNNEPSAYERKNTDAIAASVKNDTLDKLKDY